ncbi:MAG: hypothetical protein IH957_12935 [Chloroflexi bacterium]|nr:hypothetical protein [Chloroflexota bacterium]
MAQTRKLCVFVSIFIRIIYRQFEEAVADFTRALTLRPDDVETIHNRGIVFGHLKRYQEALMDFGHVLKAIPKDPEAMYNRACILALMGQPAIALEQLRDVVQRDSSYRASASKDSDFDSIRADDFLRRDLELLVSGTESGDADTNAPDPSQHDTAAPIRSS